jgi:Phytanoyl-CoA dioxygenase (PhyH)
VETFMRDGYVKVPAVVPREVANEACVRLWERIGPLPDDPSTWTQPVVWTADLTGEGPFGQIATSEVLARALDAVAGPGGWSPKFTLGNIPVRFPHAEASNDDGWHIDASVPLQDGRWAVSTRPHTLLLLVLLSDVGPDDAPTRIRIGSHHDLPRILSEDPMDPFTAGPLVDAGTSGRPLAYATGEPGDAYICHPLLVHAAQRNLTGRPRFMAQTPILLTEPLGPGGPPALATVYS